MTYTTQPRIELDRQIESYFKARGIPMPEAFLVWCELNGEPFIEIADVAELHVDGPICPAVSAKDNEGYQLRCLEALGYDWIFDSWQSFAYIKDGGDYVKADSPLAALIDVAKDKEK